MQVIQHISFNKNIRLVGQFSVFLLSILLGLTFLPISFHQNTTEATGSSDPSITMTFTNSTASVDLAVNSANGTFTPSSTTVVTITIDLDEHTKSISFTDSTFGTRTITKDSDYIVIPSGVEQTITATTDDGYAFSSWSVTSGTIGSTTTNPTTFTSTTDATITATSEVAP